MAYSERELCERRGVIVAEKFSKLRQAAIGLCCISVLLRHKQIIADNFMGMALFYFVSVC
jgi:hypothetical protein